MSDRVVGMDFYADTADRRWAEAALHEAQERMRLAAESAQLFAWDVDLIGGFIKYSENAPAVFGYDSLPPDCYSIAAARNAIHPADRERVTRATENAIERTGLFAEEFRVRSKDGSYAWCEARGRIVRNRSGEVARMIGIAQNITRRKQAEAALHASESEFRAFFELAAVGTAQVDLTTARFLRVNKYLRDMVGYSDEELSRMTFLDLTHPDDRPENLEICERARNGGLAQFTIEKRLVRKDGIPRWVQVAVSIVRDSEGKPSRTVAIIQDIEERKRRELDRAFLLSMREELAGASSPEEAMNVVARRLQEYLKVAEVAFADIDEAADEATGIYRVRGGRVLAGPETCCMPESLSSDDMAQLHAGRTLVVDHAANRLFAAKARFGAAQILVPHVSEGRWKFLLGALCEQPREWHASEIDMLHELTASTHLRIERARAEQALRVSEERYRTLFGSIDEGFCVVEVLFDDQGRPFDYRFLESNPAFEKHAGLKNAIGRSMRELMPGHEQYWYDIYGRVALTGQPVRFQNYTQALQRWYDVYAFRLGPMESRRVAILLRDITVQRGIDAKLRESEERFRAMANSSPLMIWVSDAEGWMEFLNQTCLEFFGLSSEQATTFDWRNVLHPDDRGAYFSAWMRARAHCKSMRVRVRVRRYDGQWRWIESHANPRFDAVGCLSGFIGSAPDITEIWQSKQMLQDADRRKDEFLAMLAHELRNPMAAISNSFAVVKMAGGINTKNNRAYRIIERRMRQMVRLVDDLLELSRLTRGKIELRKEWVDLSSVINDAVDASRSVIAEASHVLGVSLPSEPLKVHADPVRLAQVFANLLQNAAKYTEGSGNIWLAARRDGDEAVISVRDTGVGIPPEMLPRVFDMFVQVDRSRYRGDRGLGIGLTLVRDTVRLHGGGVEARSEGLGKGSEFLVRLPLSGSKSTPPR